MPRGGIGGTARRVNVQRDRWPLLGLVYYWPLKDQAALQLDYYGQAALEWVGSPAYLPDRHAIATAPHVGEATGGRLQSHLWAFPDLQLGAWSINCWWRRASGEGLTPILSWTTEFTYGDTNVVLSIDDDQSFIRVDGDQAPSHAFDWPDRAETGWHMITVIQRRLPAALEFHLDAQFEQSVFALPLYGHAPQPICLGGIPFAGPLGGMAINDLSIHTRSLDAQDIIWLWNGGLGRRYPHY